MKQHTSHNIICLEAEWEYSEQNPKNRFRLAQMLGHQTSVQSVYPL